MKILIAEDNRDLAEIYGELLTEYEIVIANTGKEVLTAVEREVIDLILLDLMMPDVDGLEVLDRVRDIPVLIISALDSDYIKRLCEKENIRGYLVKGASDSHNIKNKVKEIIDGIRDSNI